MIFFFVEIMKFCYIKQLTRAYLVTKSFAASHDKTAPTAELGDSRIIANLTSPSLSIASRTGCFEYLFRFFSKSFKVAQ